ncbi:MAG: hypothetical protein SOI60_08160, partial [Lachnospiraceae bacterium]
MREAKERRECGGKPEKSSRKPQDKSGKAVVSFRLRESGSRQIQKHTFEKNRSAAEDRNCRMINDVRPAGYLQIHCSTRPAFMLERKRRRFMEDKATAKMDTMPVGRLLGSMALPMMLRNSHEINWLFRPRINNKYPCYFVTYIIYFGQEVYYASQSRDQ